MSKIKTLTKVIALTSWVILDDPRRFKDEASKIFIPKETKAQLEAEEISSMVTQTVVACGPDVKSRNLMPPGTKIIVDPRMEGCLVEVNEETGEICAYVQEGQILMIV